MKPPPQLVKMIIAWQVISYCSNWQARWKFRHISGPKPSFPLGNLHTALKKGLYKAHQDWAAEFGPIYKFFLARQPVVVITGQMSLDAATACPLSLCSLESVCTHA